MKLYDNPMANSPRKVRMFLVEKNISDVENLDAHKLSVTIRQTKQN